jgi:hypothetical protein
MSQGSVEAKIRIFKNRFHAAKACVKLCILFIKYKCPRKIYPERPGQER